MLSDQLVIDVARRARRIAEKAEADKEPIDEKPVNLAISELAAVKERENR